MSDSEETISVCSDDAIAWCSYSGVIKQCECVGSDGNECSMCGMRTVMFDGYMDERFLKASPTQRAELIGMAYTIIDGATIVNKNTSKEVDELRRYYDNIISSQRDAFDKMKTEHSADMDGLREDVIRAREEREVYANQKCMGVVQEFEKYKENANILNEINESMKTIANNQLTMISPPTYSNSTIKADAGEDMIVSYLQKIPGMTVERTAGKAMCADIWCCYANCKIMIESKHVKRVNQVEVDKFHRDLKMNRRQCDGAIFVSISDDVCIPTKEMYFDLGTMDGQVPCVYVSSFESNRAYLFAAIRLIVYVKQHCGDSGSTPDVRDTIKKVTKMLESSTEQIRKTKATINVLNRDINKLEDILQDAVLLSTRNPNTQVDTIKNSSEEGSVSSSDCDTIASSDRSTPTFIDTEIYNEPEITLSTSCTKVRKYKNR